MTRLLLAAILLPHAAEAAPKCTYRMAVAGLKAKMNIEPNQKLEVLANLKCNTVEAYDIRAVADTGPGGVKAGEVIPLTGKKLEVEVNTRQIDELTKHFPGALMGMDVLVQFKSNPLRRFVDRAKTGFLSPSAGSGIALFETEYGNAKTKAGRPLFDPRQMGHGAAAEKPLTIENENFSVEFTVKKSCEPGAEENAGAQGQGGAGDDSGRTGSAY